MGDAKGTHCYPMASAGTEGTERRVPGPRRSEGGNSGESSRESPEGEEGRQDDPMNVKDRAHNRRMLGKGAERS